MLNKCKVNMKRDLENSITNYNESVLTVHQVRQMTENNRAVLPPTSRILPTLDRVVKSTHQGGRSRHLRARRFRLCIRVKEAVLFYQVNLTHGHPSILAIQLVRVTMIF